MDITTTSLAAAELADRYIDLILSTQPDLLVDDLSAADADDIVHSAERLALYRQTLIEQFQEQPLPTAFDYEEEYEEDDDGEIVDEDRR